MQIAAEDSALNQCLEYLQLIRQWNRIDNLTAITEDTEMVRSHLLDSLSVMRLLHGTTVLDVGSGAGLPGIPLAILNPEKTFTLLDAAAKRVRFMRQALVALKLQNVQVVHQRIEDLDQAARFDHIISRAFSALDVFVGQTLGHVAPGGSVVAMKGRLQESELATLPAEITYTIHSVDVPGLSAQRHLIEVIPDS
ncbi:MAG: 16S rRNA (guanine(527)-N(7))-methyltransferase RsmG [Thiotrichales bacterium]